MNLYNRLKSELTEFYLQGLYKVLDRPNDIINLEKEYKIDDIKFLYNTLKVPLRLEDDKLILDIPITMVGSKKDSLRPHLISLISNEDENKELIEKILYTFLGDDYINFEDASLTFSNNIWYLEYEEVQDYIRLIISEIYYLKVEGKTVGEALELARRKMIIGKPEEFYETITVYSNKIEDKLIYKINDYEWIEAFTKMWKEEFYFIEQKIVIDTENYGADIKARIKLSNIDIEYARISYNDDVRDLMSDIDDFSPIVTLSAYIIKLPLSPLDSLLEMHDILKKHDVDKEKITKSFILLSVFP